MSNPKANANRRAYRKDARSERDHIQEQLKRRHY
jgi:hypothetical protein